MLQKFKKQAPIFPFLQFFFVLLSGYCAHAQIYQHNFGTTTINTHPYTAIPTTLASNLSGSSWTNSTNAWSSNTGSAGQAIQLFNPAGTTTVTLTFNVAPNFQVAVTSFNFWRQRSASGPQAWQMSINGIDVGSGTTPLSGNGTGAAIGVTPVLNPVSGLTGPVTVVLTLSGATGAGNIRLDDFTLNGSVTSTCTNAVVNSYTPHSGPKDTMIIITGSGFTETASVTIDGMAMVFDIISDTEIHAMIPGGVVDGNIIVNATDGCFGEGGTPFTLIESECDPTEGTEIYISEVYDQRPGSYGAIELYNPTNSTISLTGVYTLVRWGDWGMATAVYTLNLSGSIAPHSTYIVRSSEEAPACSGLTTYGGFGAGINDYDEFHLLKNNAIIDIARAPSYAGYTVIRKPDAVAPTTAWNNADWNTTGGGTSWSNCSNLGTHTTNPTSPPPPLVSHPVPRTVCVNANTTFTATLIPTTGFTFQWKMLTSSGTWINVTNGGTYSGVTTPTLTVNNVSLAMNNSQYYLEATSTGCIVRTDAAQLFVLETPAAPTVTVTQPTCTTPTGIIEITGPPEYFDGTFTFSMDGVYGTDTVFANLAPGSTHTFTIRNSAGCTSTITTQAIGTVPGAPAAPTLTAVQPTCATATGSITVTAPVGAGYTYSINGLPPQPSPIFTPVAPGPHNITAQLAGCTSAPTAQTIDPQPATPAAPTLTATQPTCTTPGSITVAAPVGADYSYSIDGQPFQSNPIFTPVAPGPHNIIAKLVDCSSPQSTITINPVPGAPAAPTLTAVQPTCTTATGSITVTAPVGAGYSYSIDGLPYQSSPTFSPVNPGPHNITVKLNDCISAPASQTINDQPATPPAPTVTAVQPTCSTATGSITVTNPPQGPGYTYSIDGLPPQSSATFTPVAPGPHTITVILNGCTSAATSQTIDQQPETPAVPTLSAVQPTCSTATGSITVTAPVGIDYSYSIDGLPYQTSATFDPVAPGPHNITVKLGSCISAPGSITINTQPATPPAPTVTAVQPTCTTATGSITVTTPAPGSGYTYSIDGLTPQASPTFASVATGPHTIVVILNGCTSATTSQTIDAQPETPAAPTLTAVQPDCTTATGSITVDTPVGAGYTYSIDGNPYQASTIFTVAAGPHNVTAKLGNCISAPGSITIDAQPATPAVPTFNAVQPTCTTATGTLTVATPVGAGYSYSIDGGAFQTNPTFNAVLPGPHNVVAKLGNCTSAPGSITIDPQPATPAAPTLTATTQPDCTTPTGSITVTNPTQGLTYNIDGGAYQSGLTFANVAPGPHTVTAKNTSGCVSPGASITIDPALPVLAAPTLTVMQTTCTSATGTITVTAPAGAGFTYSIDGNPYQAGTIFTVTPGPHTVSVKNASGCVSPITTRTIDPQPATPAAPLLTAVQPSCGVPTGSITVGNSAGDLTYNIDGGAFQASPTFTMVPPGPHTITMKNGAGCVSPDASITINPALAVPAQPALTAVQTTCTAGTGTITVTSPIGADLTYSIDGGLYQIGTTFNTVAPGPHTITVQNGAGCVSAPKSQTINPMPTAPDVPVLAAAHPGCNATKGSIAVASPMGIGYSYSIDGLPYQTGTSFANLDPGTHTVTVKNAAGCISVPSSATINTPPAIPAAPIVSIVQPDCTTATGSITVTSPIDPATLMYSVNSLGYQSEVDFHNLAPGNYVITARNASGCVSPYTHFVINYPPLVPAVPVVTVSQPDCNKPTGTITVNSPVGFGLEYSTDGTTFQPSRIFNSLPAGTYTVTVRNTAGCSAFLAGIIVDAAPAPAPDPGIITGDNAVCQGGTIQLADTVTGGVWASSDTTLATVDANGLVTTIKAGTVAITYTMGTVCTASATHTIIIYMLPDPQLRDTYLCVDNETGTPVPILFSSGLSTAEYDFTWAKGTTPLTATTAAIIVTEPGDYTVTATNKITGCVGTSTATVGLSSIALAYADATVDFQYNQVITVHITGGSGDYEYSLDGGPYQDENSFTGIYEGEYHITVRDKHGCGELDLEVYALNYPRFFSPNGDGARDHWNIKGLRDQPDAEIFIFDRYGKLITGLRPNGPGWDGTYNAERLPATDYWFTVQYHSANGEGREFKAHFSLLR